FLKGEAVVGVGSLRNPQLTRSGRGALIPGIAKQRRPQILMSAAADFVVVSALDAARAVASAGRLLVKRDAVGLERLFDGVQREVGTRQQACPGCRRLGAEGDFLLVGDLLENALCDCHILAPWNEKKPHSGGWYKSLEFRGIR